MTQDTKPRRITRTLDAESWALIREAYAEGRTAPALARQFGIGTSTIYNRAAREGWSKRQLVRMVSPLPLPPGRCGWREVRLAERRHPKRKSAQVRIEWSAEAIARQGLLSKRKASAVCSPTTGRPTHHQTG